VQEEIEQTILGTHSYPSRPGVVVSDSQPDEEEVTESANQRVIQSLPNQKQGATTSFGIIEYAKAAGSRERIHASSQSKALALRNPYAELKPEWRAPWKLMRVISGHLGWVRAVAVDASNEWFATGAGDRTIKIWDLASGTLKLTLTGHINTVRGLAVSARHPYLFSCAEDKKSLVLGLGI